MWLKIARVRSQYSDYAAAWKTVKVWFDFQHRQELFILSNTSRPDLKPTQSLSQWYQWILPQANPYEG